MSTLIAERRRGLGDDSHQEALFGGEALAPSRALWMPPVPERGVVVPERGVVAPERAVVVPEHGVVAPERAVVAPECEVVAPECEVVAPGCDVVAPERAVIAPEREAETAVARNLRAPRAAGAALAGQTLDDRISRAWEGVVSGLPAACPVCHGEVAPSLGGPPRGRCSSCDATIE